MNKQLIRQRLEEIAIMVLELSDAIAEMEEPKMCITELFKITGVDTSDGFKMPGLPPTILKKKQKEWDALDPFVRLNDKDYPLLQSLHNQLNNFESRVWVADLAAMFKQADNYGMDIRELYEIIRSNPRLTSRFRNFPQLGV